MPDTHDERGGDEAAVRIAAMLKAYREYDDDEAVEIVHSGLYLTIGDVRGLVRDRDQLAAATARAEKAEAERDAWKSEAERRSSERNAAVRRIGLVRECLNVPGKLLPGLAELLENGTGRALSATETDAPSSGGAFQGNTSATASAALSEPQAPADCDEPDIDGICRHLTCGRCKQHTNDTHQGHYWAWCKVAKTTREFHFCCPGDCELERNDTTEDGQHG